MTIGQRIKNRRMELGLSVEELAEKLGKNKATVYRYESNFIKDLPVSVLENLAIALQTTPADLMGIDDEESTQHHTDESETEFFEFFRQNPEYHALFNSCRKVKLEDLDLVKQFIDKMTK